MLVVIDVRNYVPVTEQGINILISFTAPLMSMLQNCARMHYKTLLLAIILFLYVIFLENIAPFSQENLVHMHERKMFPR
jgi:hypothetical protein